MNQKGICVAGNVAVDTLYPVKGFPAAGELTSIEEGIIRSTGGALCNVTMDLAIMDPGLPLLALGRVGADAEADYIFDTLRQYKNIDLSLIKREGKTAFTAVMADIVSKERTFFHCKGANTQLCEDDFDWDKINVDFLHIGYILILDALDEEDSMYGTKMARLLCRAQERGIKTSLDVVSDVSGRFKRLVPPALKYADFCIINEIEASQVTGVNLRDESGRLIVSNIPEALEKMKGHGISEWAAIHCPEGGYGLDSNGNYAESPSFDLPPDYIKGTVGAGDAFCAGAIYAAYMGASLKEGLDMGNAAAAASLSMPGATEGMLPADELRKFDNRFARRKI